jgi:hypothetical protein
MELNKKKVNKLNGPICCYIDLHGHSLKKGVFIYGPEHPVYDERYYLIRILPKLLADRTEMFRYPACRFKIAKKKETTARAVAFYNNQIPYSYTVEASFASFLTKAHTQTTFTEELFTQMGKHIVASLHQFVGLLAALDKAKALQTEDPSQEPNDTNFAKSKKPKSKEKNSRNSGSALPLNDVVFEGLNLANFIAELKAYKPPENEYAGDEPNDEGRSDSEDEGDDFNV